MLLAHSISPKLHQRQSKNTAVNKLKESLIKIKDATMISESTVPKTKL